MMESVYVLGPRFYFNQLIYTLFKVCYLTLIIIFILYHKLAYSFIYTKEYVCICVGLGLNDDGTAIKVSSGLVGQEQAREAAGLIVDLIRVSIILCILGVRNISDLSSFFKT